MKKKKLKLSLNREVISEFEANSVKGGSAGCAVSVDDRQGDCSSANGCHGGADNTMTCFTHGCGTNQ
jgi:hypothetical protein